MSTWTSSNGMPPYSDETLGAGLALAELVAAGSNCVRRQVGAVLFDPTGVIKSLGFNRVATADPNCARTCPRALQSYEAVAPRTDYRRPGAECYSVHAETSALLGHEDECRGWFIITTYQPCPDCQRLLDSVGVTAVWREDV